MREKASFNLTFPSVCTVAHPSSGITSGHKWPPEACQRGATPTSAVVTAIDLKVACGPTRPAPRPVAGAGGGRASRRGSPGARAATAADDAASGDPSARRFGAIWREARTVGEVVGPVSGFANGSRCVAVHHGLCLAPHR